MPYNHVKMIVDSWVRYRRTKAESNKTHSYRMSIHNIKIALTHRAMRSPMR